MNFKTGDHRWVPPHLLVTFSVLDVRIKIIHTYITNKSIHIPSTIGLDLYDSR